MIGRLASVLHGRGRRVAPALEDRLAALERALGVKMEAQLVVLAQAVAEVVTRELAREHRQLQHEFAALRQAAGQGTEQRAGTADASRAAKASLLERAVTGRSWGARP